MFYLGGGAWGTKQTSAVMSQRFSESLHACLMKERSISIFWWYTYLSFSECSRTKVIYMYSAASLFVHSLGWGPEFPWYWEFKSEKVIGDRYPGLQKARSVETKERICKSAYLLGSMTDTGSLKLFLFFF